MNARTLLTDHRQLLELRDNPPLLGELASKASADDFSNCIEIRAATEPSSAPQAWPAPQALTQGECVALEISPDAAGAQAWLEWLDALASSELVRNSPAPALRIAPCTTQPAGTFRLWAIASARLRLPATVRVEARHDLIGIRLAQIALRFGADTLAGPIDGDRHLPLAGVTRPNENTRAGLFALIEQCGRVPLDPPGTPEIAAHTITPVLNPAPTKRLQLQ